MKPKQLLLLFFSSMFPLATMAQDTVRMAEVSVTAYPGRQTLFRSPAAAAVIDSSKLSQQIPGSLVPALNTIAGIRMEERSPGSYRLSIRGSLLRSPFGVRNVKVYLEEFPLTDAGGNTYINVIAPAAINKLELLKGPDGSLFGANSGGVANLTVSSDKEKLSAALSGGSYHLIKEDINLTTAIKKHTASFAQSFQQSDGYRQNSKLRRWYFHAADKINYGRNNELKLLVFGSDLYYQTPGGLTKAQFDADPSQARPATPTIPGAVTQRAAIYNRMIFGGIANNVWISKNVQHMLAVFGGSVDFKNPFITNYEVRREGSYGVRTWLLFSNEKKKALTKVDYVVGTEWQQTSSNILNFTNKQGVKGTLIAAGNVKSRQGFIFNRLKLDIKHKLFAEAGLSVNYYRFRFTDSAQLSNTFKPEWMPRLGMSYSISKRLSIRSSMSRGYSPPTTAEIRPSNNNIYTNLQAETGLNKEIGLRYAGRDGRLWVDIAAFEYRLHNAIVRQLDAGGAEFFVNAGSTRQLGLELQSSYVLIDGAQNNAFIKKLQLNNGSTFNHFRFRQYMNAGNDFSGNRITGVPDLVFVSSVQIDLASATNLFLQHNHTSSLPLNDANAFSAGSFDLLQLTIGQAIKLKKGKLVLNAGVDNLLNQHYSLGNDLNAVGNRFFNAAPLRNYFAGISYINF